MDTTFYTHQPTTRTSARAAQALSRAAALTAAKREIETAAAQRCRSSFLAPGAAEEWALMLTKDSPERSACNRFFQTALKTGLRYQSEVLKKEDPVARAEMGDDAEIIRTIGSTSPFGVLACLLEIAGKADPDYGAWLLACTCTAAEWPLVNSLSRTLSQSVPEVLLAVTTRSAYTAYTRAAQDWLCSIHNPRSAPGLDN